MIMSEVHRRAEREDDDHRRQREKEKREKGSYNNLMGLATTEDDTATLARKDEGP